MIYFYTSGFFLFFKQKTAYEMRISDWSSDVCSSDLADDDWSEQQGPPIADAEIGQQHPGGERAQHVLRAMSEVNDVEQAENDRKSQAEDRIERAIYQA